MPDETQVEEDKDDGSSSKATEGVNINATANDVPTPLLKEVRLLPSFLQRLKKYNVDIQFKKFVDILDQLHINVPFLEAIEQMPTYVKFLKEIVTKKRKVEKYETVATTKACCSVLSKLPPKRQDPADGFHVRTEGRFEDVIVKVDKFVLPVDFHILDYEIDATTPIILGRPFLAIGRILIDCEKCEITMRVSDQCVTVNVFCTLKYMDEFEECRAFSKQIH
ncbi:uncharacterized protein LOC120116933 [Hibiscus syriacus]|uniref:uncharacterized protein LOC120116933 n=1 Tax=Hibiscus syriacus TaxID=106335 RepID=UPI0019204EB4|nr:uncharacterized protein LOC120116933 [Hibiscus syriacus]